jgi:hypothetical protein
MILTGVIISLAIVVVGTVWLSISAETLDEIAEHFGASESSVWIPLLPDYEVPGFEGNLQTNIVVGMISTLVVLLISYGVGLALRSSEKRSENGPS